MLPFTEIYYPKIIFLNTIQSQTKTYRFLARSRVDIQLKILRNGKQVCQFLGIGSVFVQHRW